MAGRDTSDRPDGVGRAQKGWLMNKYNAIKARLERDAGVRILQKATVAVGWLAAGGGAVKGMGENR